MQHTTIRSQRITILSFVYERVFSLSLCGCLCNVSLLVAFEFDVSLARLYVPEQREKSCFTVLLLQCYRPFFLKQFCCLFFIRFFFCYAIPINSLAFREMSRFSFFFAVFQIQFFLFGFNFDSQSFFLMICDCMRDDNEYRLQCVHYQLTMYFTMFKMQLSPKTPSIA